MNRILDYAPPRGFVIACMRDQLVFSPYEIRDGVVMTEGCEFPDFTTAVECHFFDSNREYRRIFRSARGDLVETVLTAQEEQRMDPDLIYTEEVLVKPKFAEKAGLPSKLMITNRYRYSEHDTIVLEDYRISFSE